MRGLEHVDLDPQVVPEKVRGVGVVGEDAADLRRGEDDDLRPVRLEERPGGGLIAKVQLARRCADQPREPLSCKVPPYRGPDEAAMARHIYRRRSAELTFSHNL